VELIADTTFLIGLWRRQSWAVSYAKANTHRAIGLPWIVLGEFWHGAVRAEHDPEVVERFLSIGLPLVDAESAVPAYAKICSGLQAAGFYQGIGQNDLWIAAVCLAFDRPLVTRNRRHFDKIDGLRLEVLA
jgi:tRNA(fMet)-specific endonuclease VapC